MFVRVIICLIILFHSKVEGTSQKHEDKTISIKTELGEVYDCINFYKQPAFDNHLLKNITSKESISGSRAPSGIGLKDGGCPNGMVPILRMNEQTQNHNFSHTISLQGDPVEPDHCYAIVRTNEPSSVYHGVAGNISIYNPKIKGNQWSASRMRISNGPDSMEVGWMVNEDLYKDDNTHLYIRFIANGKGCFDLQCPGFVQVAKDVAIGSISKHMSVRGTGSWVWALSIDKHQDDGNWWVSIGEEKYGIGYWPKTLFSSLADTGNQVEWGGEVYYQPGVEAPGMGCGYRAVYDTKLAAYWCSVTIVDQHFQTIIPPLTTVKYQNCETLYNVLDSGYTGPQWGRVIEFGGTSLP